MRFDRARVGVTFGQVRTWQLNRIVRSVQYGTISMGNGVGNASAAINVVDVNNTLIHNTGHSSTDFIRGGRVELFDATTVKFYRDDGTTGVNNFIGGFCVVEYFPGVFRSIERGALTVPGGAVVSATATLTSPVDPLTAILENIGVNATSFSTGPVLLVLTNATTITGSRITTGGPDMTAGWQVAYPA